MLPQQHTEHGGLLGIFQGKLRKVQAGAVGVGGKQQLPGAAPKPQGDQQEPKSHTP